MGVGSSTTVCTSIGGNAPRPPAPPGPCAFWSPPQAEAMTETHNVADNSRDIGKHIGGVAAHEPATRGVTENLTIPETRKRSARFRLRRKPANKPPRKPMALQLVGGRGGTVAYWPFLTVSWSCSS